MQRKDIYPIDNWLDIYLLISGVDSVSVIYKKTSQVFF